MQLSIALIILLHSMYRISADLQNAFNKELTFLPLSSQLSFLLVIPETKTLLVLVFVDVASVIILFTISSGDDFAERSLVPW